MRSGLYIAVAAALVTLAATAVITAPHRARAYADQDGGDGFAHGLYHPHHDRGTPGRDALADLDFGLPGEHHHHHHSSGFIGDNDRDRDPQNLFTPTDDSVGQNYENDGTGGWSGFGESGFSAANFGFSNFWSNVDGFGGDGGSNSGSLGNWDFFFGFDSGGGGFSLPSGTQFGFNWPPILPPSGFFPPGTGGDFPWNSGPWNSGDPDFWQPTGDDLPPGGSPTQVPEPGSILLFGAGLATLALASAARRRARARI